MGMDNRTQTPCKKRTYHSASTLVGFVVLGVFAAVPLAVCLQLSGLALFGVFWLHGAGGYLNAVEFLAFFGMLFGAFLRVFGFADINLFALVPKGIGPAFFGHLMFLQFLGRGVVGDENSRVTGTAQVGVVTMGICTVN